MFFLYIKRIFSSYIFWICVIVIEVMLIAGCYGDLIYARISSGNAQSIVSLFSYTTDFGIGEIIAYIVPSLPFLCFFVEEKNSSIAYYQLVRSSKQRYFLSQIFSAVISVTFVLAISITVFVIICYLYGANFDLHPCDYERYGQSVFSGIIKNGTFYLFCIICVSYIIHVLPGILCGMVLSHWIKNKYIIFAIPFVSYRIMQSLSVITNIYHIDWYYAYLPSTTLSDTVEGTIYIFTYPIVFSLLLACIYYYFSMRRFYNGKI